MAVWYSTPGLYIRDSLEISVEFIPVFSTDTHSTVTSNGADHWNRGAVDSRGKLGVETEWGNRREKDIIGNYTCHSMWLHEPTRRGQHLASLWPLWRGGFVIDCTCNSSHLKLWRNCVTIDTNFTQRSPKNDISTNIWTWLPSIWVWLTVFTIFQNRLK